MEVLHNPHKPHLFLSLEKNLVYLWNIENSAEPLSLKRLSKKANLTVDWNHTGNTFVIGGTNNSIKLIDTRLFDNSDKNPIVCKITNGYNDEIKDIKFNKFVPHWIATSSSDSTIKIWDLRYPKYSMVTLADHCNGVNKISWCPSHVDIICSGSVDQSVKFWSIAQSPHHVLTTYSSTFELPVSFVGFSPVNPLKCTAITSNGSLRTLHLTHSFLEDLIQSKFDSPNIVDNNSNNNNNNIKEKEIEKLIYFRNFAKGFEQAKYLAETISKTSVQKAINILELCYERTPPDSEIEVVPTIMLNNNNTSLNPKQLFENELQSYIYYIPPNYPEHLAIQPDSYTMSSIALLKMNLELQLFVEKREINEIIDREKEIFDMLQKDIDSISITTLERLLKVFKSFNFNRAIQFTEELVEIFSNGHINMISPLVKNIISPTIYDTIDNKDNSNLSKILNQPEQMTEQLVFMRRFFKLLWSLNANDLHKVIPFFEEQRPKIVLSATINRIYFNALLQFNFYDKFYNQISEFMKLVEGYIFYNVLNDLKQEAFELLQNFIDPSTSPNGSGALDIFNQITDKLLCAINILQNCQSLPANVLSYLTANFSQLNIDLENTLFELRKIQNGKQITQK